MPAVAVPAPVPYLTVIGSSSGSPLMVVSTIRTFAVWPSFTG